MAQSLRVFREDEPPPQSRWFGKVPDYALDDVRLTDADIRVLGALALLAVPTWPRMIQGHAIVAAKSLLTGRGLLNVCDRLEATGYIRRERDYSRPRAPRYIVLTMDETPPFTLESDGLRPNKRRACNQNGALKKNTCNRNRRSGCNQNRRSGCMQISSLLEDFKERDKKMKTGESSSSLFSQSEIPPETMARCLRLGDSSERKAQLMAEQYTLAHLEAALTVVERKPAPCRGWAYLVGVLKTFQREGLSAARRPPKADAPVRQSGGLPEEVIPIGAEEVAALVAEARGRSQVAKLALLRLRIGVKGGHIPAELVPLELLSPEKEPAAGVTRQSCPRGPVGASGP